MSHRLEGATVGHVRGRHELDGAVRAATAEHDFERVTFDGTGGIVGEVTAAAELDYLVLDGGPGADDVLQWLAREDVSLPTLYVGSDPAAARAAMTTSADVFLHADNASRLPARLESLAVGAAVESVDAEPRLDGLGDFHYAAYTTLMEGFEDHVYVFDRHGRFVRVNDAKAAFHDLEPDALEGTTDFHHFSAESAMDMYVDTMAVMEGYAELDNEAEWITNDRDERIHVTASKHPIETDADEVIGLIGISREITQLTKQKMMVERMKEAVEHLYGTYDHNFHNRSQVQIGVVTLLNKAEHHGENVSRALTDVEDAVDALETVLERDGAMGDGAVGDSAVGDGVVDDENRAVADGSAETVAPDETPGSDPLASITEELRSVSVYAGGHVDDLFEYLGEARSESRSLTDGLNRLIGDFSDLISVVNTSGEVRELNVGQTAERVFRRPVDYEDVTVETDHHKLELMFEQIRTSLGASGRVTIGERPRGFALRLPAHLEVPELKRRFRDQDLREGVDPLLKLRLLAKTQGWQVDAEHPDPETTVMVFDVEDWKTDADSL